MKKIKSAKLKRKLEPKEKKDKKIVRTTLLDR